MSIWDEILTEAAARSSAKLPDEMTVGEFAERVGMNVAMARKYLAELYEQEKVTKRWVYHDGATRLAYKPTDA